MNSSTPGQRRGAHRTRRDITAALVPALLAVVAVAALIIAINVWRGQESDDNLGRSTTAGTSSSASQSGTPSASASASAANAAERSDDPSSSDQPSSSDPSASDPSGSDEPSDGASQDIGVVVLNQTSRGGLASVAADRLRARGWTVTGVGNFTGIVPATTVYYPPGAEVAAQAAAESLPTPARTRPRFGNLSTSRLTVVVTDNYPS